MSQIAISREQRKRIYRDIIADCHNRANLPWLLDKAAKLYGALAMADLIELLKATE